MIKSRLRKFIFVLLLAGIAITLSIGVLRVLSYRKGIPGDFDLVAVSVAYAPNSVHAGDRVVFSKRIRNDGTNTVPRNSYNEDLYLNGKGIMFDHAGSELGSGRSNNAN